MKKALVVLAVLIVFSSLAQAGVSAGATLIQENHREFKLGAKIWISVAAYLDDTPVCFLETDTGIPRTALYDSRISYHIVVGIAGLQILGSEGGLSLYLPCTGGGTAIKMDPLGDKFDTQSPLGKRPVTFWECRILSQQLLPGPNPMHLILHGNFHRVDQRILGFIKHGKNKYSDTQAILALNLSIPEQRIGGWSPKQVFRGYFQPFGWYPFKREPAYQMVPETTMEPAKLIESVETPAISTTSNRDGEIAQALESLASATREQSRTNAEVQATLKQLRREEEKPVEQPVKPVKENGLWLSIVEPTGRSYQAPQAISVTRQQLQGGWAIIAHFPEDVQQVSRSLKGPGICDEKVISARNGTEDFSFHTLNPGTYTFTVRASGKTETLTMEVR